MKRTRINLELDSETMDRIKNIQDAIQAASATEVIRRAVAAFEYVTCISDECDIAVVNGKTGAQIVKLKVF